jgi:uncharacterized Zn-finger protein
MVHEKLKPFQCKICQISVSLEHNLKRHIEQVHLNLLPFQCQICPTRTYSRSDLRNHMEHFHEAKRFKCKTCGSKFWNIVEPTQFENSCKKKTQWNSIRQTKIIAQRKFKNKTLLSIAFVIIQFKFIINA